MQKKIKGGDEVLNWGETGFYKSHVANKANSKIPSVAYTKEENQITLETARGNNSFSGILADDSVLVECDDQQNSELLLKIIQGEHLNFLVTDRSGGKGIHG